MSTCRFSEPEENAISDLPKRWKGQCRNPYDVSLLRRTPGSPAAGSARPPYRPSPMGAMPGTTPSRLPPRSGPGSGGSSPAPTF